LIARLPGTPLPWWGCLLDYITETPVPPTFYFAIGARPRRRDLDVALATQQQHFLLPVGSTAIPWLRHRPGVRVGRFGLRGGQAALSSPTLAAYAQAILAWRLPDGSWGNLDWAATYDHIGNPTATIRDHARLLALLRARGAGDAPIIASVQYPEDAGAAILRDVHQACHREPVTTRPRFGIGGLVPVLRPTQPRVVFQEADAWFDTMLDDLTAAIDAGADPQSLGLHLFGIGRPGFVLRSPLVVSCDSSGPAQMAMYGWQTIASHYTPAYGLSAEKLQTSREARLAYGLVAYAAALGLPWYPVDDADFQNDPVPSPWVQLSLDTLLVA
jgi:hypothetical protein